MRRMQREAAACMGLYAGPYGPTGMHYNARLFSRPLLEGAAIPHWPSETPASRTPETPLWKYWQTSKVPCIYSQVFEVGKGVCLALQATGEAGGGFAALRCRPAILPPSLERYGGRQAVRYVGWWSVGSALRRLHAPKERSEERQVQSVWGSSGPPCSC
jgi:hypothetical protein